MNGTVKIFFICLFSFVGVSVFSQKKNEITVKGTVYMNASRSQGIMNGKTFSEPQRTFRNQNIYFKSDSASVKTRTDSVGVYSVVLKPGTYEVLQEAGLNAVKDGMTHIGSYVVVVEKGGGPYNIFFENHVNGRSAIMKGGNLQGSTPTKTKKEIGPKNQ